ncbi:hypothetical protein RRG08_013537 [Elysia crispata]|uniref:Uncharacterized protein n=1 Tax=Elysia crispata TaxID=231223 RepID=A0AAE1CQH2_9GAST|nr:hypothetical protein RRG08_013537 [Elysia crispata]
MNGVHKHLGLHNCRVLYKFVAASCSRPFSGTSKVQPNSLVNSILECIVYSLLATCQEPKPQHHATTELADQETYKTGDPEHQDTTTARY